MVDSLPFSSQQIETDQPQLSKTVVTQEEGTDSPEKTLSSSTNNNINNNLDALANQINNPDMSIHIDENPAPQNNTIIVKGGGE